MYDKRGQHQMLDNKACARALSQYLSLCGLALRDIR